MKSVCHTTGGFGTTQAKLIELFSKPFIKIYYFPKFRCQILSPSKVTGCSIFNYFQQVLIATSFEPQAFRTIFESLFEGTKTTTKFQKDTSATYPALLLLAIH